MAEGKLICNEKTGKRQIEFFNEKKKQVSRLDCAEEQISVDLMKDGDHPVEVEFDRQPPYGTPLKVRAKGKEFIALTPAPSTPSPQGQPLNRNEMPQMTAEFHNPYNFIPAPPRDNDRVRNSELGDRLPTGHDRFEEDKFSGKLKVRMTVTTPLLLPDTARVEMTGEHKTFDVRLKKTVDKDGNSVSVPDINPTAVKGMLRSAYEAITNSRFSVFHNHDERLAFRMDAREGLHSVLARITLVDGGADIQLLTGTVREPKIGDNGKPSPDEPMYAAWLKSYTRQGTYRGKYAAHRAKVWAYIVRAHHPRKGFDYWNVQKLEEGSIARPVVPPADSGASALTGNNRWVAGYVCISNKNIENKHDERVFFMDNANPIPAIRTIGKEWGKLSSEWKRLIEDYAETDHTGKPAGIELSRHIQHASTEKVLTTGTLCYARVQKIDGSWTIQELIPVMISRRLHSAAPDELLPRTLHPAQSIAELSPADRVFGWVRQPASKNLTLTTQQRFEQDAYRGQLRIGAIRYSPDNRAGHSPVTSLRSSDGSEDSLPLAILGQPKPQQGRFYVARNAEGDAQPDRALTSEGAGYTKLTSYPHKHSELSGIEKGLRGRKVYPHHKVPKDYWFPVWQQPTLTMGDHTFFQEYRRPDGKDQRDKQNRSLRGWVSENTMFDFEIDFQNLSEVELGALLWLLELRDGLYLRFGGGKPLGFGSVRLTLSGYHIFDGAALSECFKSLASEEGPSSPVNFKSAFKERSEGFNEQTSAAKSDTLVKTFQSTIRDAYGHNNQEFEQIAFVEAFLRAAEGFAKSGLPIHYPRARRYEQQGKDGQKQFLPLNNPSEPLPPHQDGLAYEWFVENNRVGNRVLPDLARDKGFEIFEHKVKPQ